jgi:hypothetical protein
MLGSMEIAVMGLRIFTEIPNDPNAFLLNPFKHTRRMK